MDPPFAPTPPAKSLLCACGLGTHIPQQVASLSYQFYSALRSKSIHDQALGSLKQGACLWWSREWIVQLTWIFSLHTGPLCRSPLSTQSDRQSPRSAPSMTSQTTTTTASLTTSLYTCELVLPAALPPPLLVGCSNFSSFPLNFAISVRP